MADTLVIGGTGAMGRRVVLRLLTRPDATVTILTRNPNSDQAIQLAAIDRGRVKILKGDVNDRDSVEKALLDTSRVFCNTDFFSSKSAVGEYRQGLLVLEAAQSAGIERFIWSSLDSAVTLTHGRIAVPHYDGKAAVAAHINLHRAEEMMRKDLDGWFSEHVSILTTSPYFENLQLRLAPKRGVLPDGREGLTFAIPIGKGKYPLIGLDDIAWFVDFMFENWQSWEARDLAVSGDSLTGQEIAAAFESVTGIPSAYAAVPLEALRSNIPEVGHDFAAMFQFFQERDVFERDRDLAFLRHLHPTLSSFKDWLRSTNWRGDEIEVQKFPITLPEDARKAASTSDPKH